MNNPSNQVHWLALGGTIQSVGHDPLDADRYFMTGKMLTPEELLAPVADFAGEVRVEACQARPSHELTIPELLKLASRIRQLAAPGPDRPTGIIITCGSNGLEELAYLLWLFYDGSVPVVVTAAMRPPTAIGSDALPNLICALATARSLADLPPVTIATDNVLLHPADAFKTHTSRIDAFSASAPAFGTLTPEREIRIWRPRNASSPLGSADLPTDLPAVEIVYSYLGSNGTTIRAAVDAGVGGIVVAGTGAGFSSSADELALAEASRVGVLVCRSKRTPGGLASDAVGGDTHSHELAPQKARLAVSAGLALDLGKSGIQSLLDISRDLSAH